MARSATLLLPFVFLLLTDRPLAAGTEIKMVRSLSGPSGKVVGPKFVLDEIRNRFVYPQENSLTVYFEFNAPKGDYILTAYWKDPDGRAAAISPDLKIQTVDKDLNAYWIFMIDPQKASGVWTVEVRINGEPVGTHSFELVVPAISKQTSAEEIPAEPTMDELYRSVGKSLVWVHKLDGKGRHLDSSSGFVVASNAIMTAFQSIDSAAAIEIEFSTGSKTTTDEVIACNRLQDWAIVKADTRDTPALVFGKPESIRVGEDAIAFSTGMDASRAIGTVDITGQREVPGFGERTYINPQLSPQAVGGPLLDFFGRVIGVIGGSTTPGMGLNSPMGAINGVVAFRRFNPVLVTPIDKKVLIASPPVRTMQSLYDSGVLTHPLSTTPLLKSGVITDKIASDFADASKTQFSRKDPEIIVSTIWERMEKANKGIVSANIYDATNKARFATEPHDLKLLPGELMKSQYSFNPRNLEPGPYRIDFFWNGVPVWRAFISITD